MRLCKSLLDGVGLGSNWLSLEKAWTQLKNSFQCKNSVFISIASRFENSVSRFHKIASGFEIFLNAFEGYKNGFLQHGKRERLFCKKQGNLITLFESLVLKSINANARLIDRTILD